MLVLYFLQHNLIFNQNKKVTNRGYKDFLFTFVLQLTTLAIKLLSGKESFTTKFIATGNPRDVTEASRASYVTAIHAFVRKQLGIYL